jgi:maleamate amidohydrolase
MRDGEQLARYRSVGIGMGEVGLGDRPAVLVIDCQRAFLEGPLGTSTSGEMLERVAELIALARAHGLPVIYACIVYDSPQQAGLVWSLKCPGMRDCLRGSAAIEIPPPIEPRPGDLVIEKHRASAFFGTDLRAELRRLGIDSLLVVGTSTSGCVRATVVDAAQHDFRVTVVEECVEDRAPASHRAALTDIQAKYGDVVPLRVLQHRWALSSSPSHPGGRGGRG